MSEKTKFTVLAEARRTLEALKARLVLQRIGLLPNQTEISELIERIDADLKRIEEL